MLNSSQTMVASYRYDPFGNTISSSGSLASANTYRFSSKEIHANSRMYYYGYRFYDPNLQGGLYEAPLGDAATELVLYAGREIGAPTGDIEGNLYAFVLNQPLLLIDPYGLFLWSGTTPEVTSSTNFAKRWCFLCLRGGLLVSRAGR